MKKVLVCALAALFLMATCLTAFAVDVEYITTTTYVDNKLEIKTTATGTEPGEMLTYLAYTDEDPTDETIVYIDQQTFDGSTPVVFSYTSDDVKTINDLSKITVKSGSSKSDKANTLTEETRNAYRTINVVVKYSVANNEEEDVTIPVKFPKTYSAEAGDLNLVNTGHEIKDGYVLDREATADYITVTDGEVAGYIQIKDTGLQDGDTVTVAVKKDYSFVASVDPNATKSGRYEGYSDNTAAEKLTIFGKVVTDIAVGAGDWGGIILSKDEAGLNYEAAKAAGRLYPAKFKGSEGQFAVQLVNYGSKELMDDWYACIYVRNLNNETIYGETIEFKTEQPATPAE